MHDKITPTADLISYFRIFSDVPYTKEIAEMTQAEKTARDMLSEHFNEAAYLAVMAESRFKRINKQIDEYKNILEVAVGRSPRDLIYSQNPEVTYVATDLPDSLKQHELVIQELMRKYNLTRPNLHFAPVNVLNETQFDAAAKLVSQGPVAIISEGCMVYLPKEEKKTFLKNVHKILKEKGGIFVTSDVTFMKKGNDTRPQGLLQAIANSAGRDMRDCSFDSLEDAKDFFTELGFSSETFLDEVDVVSLKALNLQDDHNARRSLSLPIWVLKVKK